MNIDAILIKMNTDYWNKPRNIMLQLQHTVLLLHMHYFLQGDRKHNFFFLQFVAGPLFSVLKKLSLKYMRSNMFFTFPRFQDD